MKLSYQYIFKKDNLKIDQEELISAFEHNFIRSGCYHKINRGEGKLDLYNHVFDFNYYFKMISPGNLWYGIGNMHISITSSKNRDSQIVEFSVSIIKSIVFQVLFIILCGIILLFNYQTDLFYFFILFNIITIGLYYIRYIRHRRFFNRTIKIGDFYKYQVVDSKYYDWNLILKNKPNSEIIEIIQGNTHLSDYIIDLAKKELENRNAVN